MDIVNAIIEFESGTLNLQGTLDLFAQLIKNGQAWQLQGSYGRTAQGLIDSGIITREGVITPAGLEAIDEYDEVDYEDDDDWEDEEWDD